MLLRGVHLALRVRSQWMNIVVLADELVVNFRKSCYVQQIAI